MSGDKKWATDLGFDERAKLSQRCGGWWCPNAEIVKQDGLWIYKYMAKETPHDQQD